MKDKKSSRSQDCDVCKGSKYHIDVDAMGYIFVTPCNNLDEQIQQNMKVSCHTINMRQIDPEDKKKIPQLNTFSMPIELYNSMINFIKNWPKIKMIKKHYEIVKNPENYNIARPVALNQFTAMHLLTRNQVFQIISDKDRSQKYTKVSEITGELLDIGVDREFLGWGGGVHFTLKGALLSNYDQQIFDACIKIWHQNNSKGIVLVTNLSEIWKAMGNKSRLNSTKIDSLKRSLGRLVTCSISAKSLDNKSFWAGGILDDINYVEKSNHKLHQIVISFNKYMIHHYLSGSYATISHPTYQNLTPYARKIYLFLMSHEDPSRKMKIEKWYSPLGVNTELSKKEFKRKIKDALEEMKEKNILLPESCIDKQDIVYTIVSSDSWIERKNLLGY